MKTRLVASLVLLIAVLSATTSPVSASADMPIGFFTTYNWSSRWVDAAMSSDGGTVFAARNSDAAYVDNVWRSTDGGEIFVELATSPEGHWLAVDTSSDGRTVFGVYSTATVNTVARSTNGGNTWSDSFSDLTRSINDVAVSDDGQVVAVVFGTTSVFFSTNGGNTWDTSIILPGNVSRVDLSGDGTTVVAVGGQYAYTSIDGGSNWTSATVTTLSQLSSVSVSEDGSKVLAGSWAGTDGDAWISNDGGSTFTPAGFSSEYGSSVQGVYTAMSTDGSTMLWSYYFGPLMMSRDGGNTWTNPDNLYASWLAFATNADGTRGFLSVEGSGSKHFRRVSPEIASVTPGSAASGVAHEITVRGDNFYDGCEVLLGSTALSTEFVSSTRLRADVPSTLSGMFDLTVECDGLSATLEATFNLRTTTTSSESTLPPTGGPSSSPGWIATLLVVAGAVVILKLRRSPFNNA